MTFKINTLVGLIIFGTVVITVVNLGLKWYFAMPISALSVHISNYIIDRGYK